MKYYKVKRYVIEEFEIKANSRKEAVTQLKGGNVCDPVSVTVIKETIKIKSTN